MQEQKRNFKAFGLNEYGVVDFPSKFSNVKISRIEYGVVMGCSWCFPHGYETSNATLKKNKRSWKFYRRKQYE